MRLIDPNKIRFTKAPIAPLLVGNPVHWEWIAFLDEVNQIPIIEAEPVKHAHWIPEYPNKRTGKAYSHKCSECKKTVYNNWQVSIEELGYVFCPNCGAKMDKKIVSDEDEAK